MKRGGYTHEQAAIKYRVKKPLVSQLLSDFKRNKDILLIAGQKILKRYKKAHMVRDVAHNVVKLKGRIWKSQQISDQVSLNHSVTVSNSFVSKVLRRDVGLSYRKLKRTSFLGNAPRCLV